MLVFDKKKGLTYVHTNQEEYELIYFFKKNK